MNVFDLLAADPNVAPAFAAVFRKPNPDEAGALAKAKYVADCKRFGHEVDGVMADETYRRAKCAAEGRNYFSGD